MKTTATDWFLDAEAKYSSTQSYNDAKAVKKNGAVRRMRRKKSKEMNGKKARRKPITIFDLI